MAGDRFGFEPQPSVELPDLSPSPADTYTNPTEIVVDSKGRVTSVTEGGGAGGSVTTIVRGGSYGTEQAGITVPQAGAGDPKFTLGFVIMARPDDGKIYTITRFAVRLGSYDGPNITISDDFTVGLRRVTYVSGTAVISTISYGTSDGDRGQAAKTTAPNATVAVGEDVYVYAVGVFGGTTISAGPISWEVTYTIT